MQDFQSGGLYPFILSVPDNVPVDVVDLRLPLVQAIDAERGSVVPGSPGLGD